MIPFVLAVSLAASPAVPSSLVVADPVCLGAGDAACVALPALLRSRLATEGVSVLPAPIELTPCADSTCAARIAEQTGAHAVVTLLAVRAGPGVLLDVSLVERDGHVAFSERAELAAESDLDPLRYTLDTYNVPGQLQAHGLTIGAGASVRTRL